MRSRSRARRLVAPVIGALLALTLSVGSPLATTAVADPVRPPSTDDITRQADLARQRAVAKEEQRQADIASAAAAKADTDRQREIARQLARSRDETIAAARTGAGGPARAQPLTPSMLGLSLAQCDAQPAREQLVQYGTTVLLSGGMWLAKNRGLIEAYIQGVTVQATVNGVAIADAARYLTPPAPIMSATLGDVWMTRWEYPFDVPATSALAIELVVTLDHPIVGLVLFDEDGHPLISSAGGRTDLRCTLLPALAVTGRVTGAGDPIADAAVTAADAATGLGKQGATGNANGEFTMLLVPGNYRFMFRSAAGLWLPEWWDDKPSFNDATIVTLAFGNAPPHLLADLSRGTRVSGHVTDADTHAPLADVYVYAQDPYVGCCFSATTGADGAYAFAAPPGASLIITFDPPRGDVAYLTQYWNGKRSFEEADHLAVGNADLTGIDAAVERGVFVRGHVTDALTHAPIANVGISASAVSVPCCQNFSASTNADGAYALPVPKDSSVAIGFFPPTSVHPYIPTYWDGKGSFATADPVAVGTQDVVDIDAAIETGVYLRGRVTDALTGGGVERTTVVASERTCCSDPYFAFTSADGTYTAVVPTNVTLRVFFNPPSTAVTPYLSQYYHGRASAAEADAVNVTTGDVEHIDAALERGVLIRGHVTDAATTAPIAHVSVTASRVGVACCENTFAMTDVQGAYAVVVRPNTSVTVEFSPPTGSSYIEEWWNDAQSSATAEVVAVGTSDVTSIDAALERGVFVRGHVTDAETAAPIAGVGVVAFPTASACCSIDYTSTDSAGAYVLVVRPGTSLKISFSPPQVSAQAYLGQWYHGKRSFDAADPIVVGATDVSGIDTALERGAFVRGRVTDAPSGAPLLNVFVSAQPADGSCCDQWYAWTGTDGRYAVPVPRGTTLKVSFNPMRDEPAAHVREWWNDRHSFDEADAVAVNDANVDGIDAALAVGVFVSGQVTDAVTHDGISSVYVDALVIDPLGTEQYGSNTDPSGAYRIVVRRGVQVKVTFFAPYGTDYVTQYWNAKPDFASADVISVGDAGVPGINAALAHGPHISGLVKDAAGAPIANVSVNVEIGDSCCSYVGGAATGTDGTYLVGVVPGRYKVHFYPPFGSAFLPEYYDDKTDWNTATVVVVGTSSVTNVDAVLAEGIHISGHVTETGGAAVAGAGVSLYSATTCCIWIAGAMTGSDGTYSLAAPPGTYKLVFYGPNGSDLLNEFYDDKATFDTATPLTLGASPLTGIDAVLAHGVLISGHVRGPDGKGLASASVNLYDAGTCCTWEAGASTLADGSYALAVPPGTYKLDFGPPYGSDLLHEYYEDKTTFGLADPVTAVVGTPLTIDATLERGVTVSGRVTDASTGSGVGGVTVVIETVTCCQAIAGVATASDGTYAVNVAPGTYKIGFFPPSGALRSEFYDDKSTFDAADSVIVGSGGLSGINASLSPP